VSAEARSRIHFGEGVLDAGRHMSVFINCPYDSEYLPIFDAVVFATICCGFLPRCAIESGCTAIPRMDRITEAILASKYSIHDLCRCRGEGNANLARFNMPLELGVSMAQRFAPGGTANHDWLLLVPRGSEYVRFLSDLAGFDPKQHDGNLETVIPAVMSWLATRPDAVEVPTPLEVLEALPAFQQHRHQLDVAWKGDTPWADVVLLGMRIAQVRGLIPSPQRPGAEATSREVVHASETDETTPALRTLPSARS
jgi:hypothetical protein